MYINGNAVPPKPFYFLGK